MKQIQKSQHITADGSPTLYMEHFDEYYHSKHGAIQEALHVYLDKGFAHWCSQNKTIKHCRIFEMGFGTGLNAFLSAEAASSKKVNVYFDSIEAYPLDLTEQKEAGYLSYFSADRKKLFEKIIDSSWEEEKQISPNFYLTKLETRLEDFSFKATYDVIYYDAFGARTQPELWEDSCFPALVAQLNPGGVFVTYSAKGSVRRALERLGLTVTLEPGPPGKREMIRATRPLL